MRAHQITEKDTYNEVHSTEVLDCSLEFLEEPMLGEGDLLVPLRLRTSWPVPNEDEMHTTLQQLSEPAECRVQLGRTHLAEVQPATNRKDPSREDAIRDS